MKKLSKTEAKEEIEKFFSDVKNKSADEIKKIKKLAMRYNIKLGDNKKLFCKKCFSPYKTPSIRVNKGKISIACENCDYVASWKVD